MPELNHRYRVLQYLDAVGVKNNRLPFHDSNCTSRARTVAVFPGTGAYEQQHFALQDDSAWHL